MTDRDLYEDYAMEAFRMWVKDLTDGELRDMLVGNATAYQGMPDLSCWLEQFQLNAVSGFNRAEP